MRTFQLRQTAQPPHFTEAQRAGFAAAITRLFDEHWQLGSADALMLLGLNEQSRTTLERYRDGRPIGQNRDLLERISHLLGIHKSLRLLYPENPEMRDRWMSLPNEAFGGNRPLDVARAYGLPGLLMLRAHLDRRRGH
ncbi:MAG TPA: MbcA/ParS/Xre antitoxin family protein [Gammaproteobacteria bacterium]|nr:MbcA/ParS/Xre antitoxin family protein [Gammaproteobacteria bacterium]